MGKHCSQRRNRRLGHHEEERRQTGLADHPAHPVNEDGQAEAQNSRRQAPADQCDEARHEHTPRKGHKPLREGPALGANGIQSAARLRVVDFAGDHVGHQPVQG